MTDYDKIFRDTIRYAYKYSPFYKYFYSIKNIDIFGIDGLKDYNNIPILRKDDILSFLEKSKMSIQEIWCDRNNIIEISTTGTTAKRLLVPYKENEINVEGLLTALQWWGYKRDDPLNSLIFGHPRDLPTVFLSNLANSTGGEIYPYTKIKQWIDSIKFIKGETITLSPSLSNLLNMLKSPLYFRLFKKIHLKYIITLVTPPELKMKLHIDISRRFNDLNIIPAYGSVEMGLVGFACPHTFSSTYTHIINKGLFHIINQNNLLDNKGEGELLFTSLGRKSFPFIKYATGDIVNLKQANELNNCGHSNRIVRFESRKSLVVKIPDAGGYFIDIFKVDEIVKEIIPGSQIICIYGEKISNYKLFLAIFIGLGMETKESHEILKEKILEKIIINHLSDYKIRDEGINNLISIYSKYMPMFFINSIDIPKESEASKPKVLLNLMQDKDLFELDIYKNIFLKLKDYIEVSSYLR